MFTRKNVVAWKCEKCGAENGPMRNVFCKECGEPTGPGARVPERV